LFVFSLKHFQCFIIQPPLGKYYKEKAEKQG